MTCDARIRLMRPISDIEVVCTETTYHTTHKGTIESYAYPGSQTLVTWFDDDRRCFHGEWPGDCQGGPDDAPALCILPLNHHGGHAQ